MEPYIFGQLYFREALSIRRPFTNSSKGLTNGMHCGP